MITIGLVVLFPYTSLYANYKTPFLVNGISPFYDKLTDTYLLSIDESIWGGNWQADVSLSDNSSWNYLTINGTSVNGKFTFTDINGEKSYQIEASSQTEKKSFLLRFTFLPIIQFAEGVFNMDYTTDNLVIQYSGKISETMPAKIKWRGGTTNIEGKNKRNYKVKFIDDHGNKYERSFFNMRKDDVWILDAGQVDMFRMRNLIASQIWQDFASKPYYVDREPKVLSATRGQMVEVFLGEQYQGIFNLCEPIDRKQMKLKKFDSDGTIHGGLWKATSFGDATFWNIPAEYDNTKEQNDVWEIKYPKIDDLCPSDYSTLYNAIMFVATASDEDFQLHIAEYFDIPVLIDYYLFVALTNGFDICGKNVYWAVYDKVKSKMLTPAMWDLDCTMGQNFTDAPLHPDYVAYDYPLLTPNKIFYMLFRLNPNNFKETTYKRYSELRKSLFHTASLQQRYIDAYNRIFNSGAVAREEKRWSNDTDISGLHLDLKAELDYICDWITHRMEFLDNQFSYTQTSISPIEHNPNARDKRCFTIKGTIASPTYKGIVINGGKLELRK